MTNIITATTIEESIKAVRAGTNPLVTTDYRADAGPDMITQSALITLRKHGYTQAGFEGSEMPGKQLLVFSNPKTGASFGGGAVDHNNKFGIKYGENGPILRLSSVDLSRLDLIEQIADRNKPANKDSTYISLTHYRDRQITPNHKHIVIGNEAFLSNNEPGHILSIYREGKYIKFEYVVETERDGFPDRRQITTIPADKVETLRIGDQGALIDPKTITAKPLVIDLPKSIETGKIVKPGVTKAELDLPELGIRLADAYATTIDVPAVQNALGKPRQV
ncbi:MAG: hypothetical protein V4735_09270 [Pseudomonadota bacterium]